MLANLFMLINMSNQERESFVFRIEQLEENQRVLALDMAEMKRQLQDALSQLHQQFDERSVPTAPVVVVNEPTEDVSYKDELHQQPTQVQSYEYQLVFDRSGSRAVLIEALLKAQTRLIIVCPWLSRNSIDPDLMQKFRDCLNRNCHIDIGWGYLSGRGKTGIAWGNSAIKDLKQLERDYPKQFKLKLLGTHEKFLVCDDSIAMLGSHNMLSSNAQGVTREVGIRTTDPQIIQGLINRFDGAFNSESLDVQDISEDSDAILINSNNELDDQDSDDITGDEQVTVVNTEELLRRFEVGERDFTGINLSGANLSGKSFDFDARSSEAIILIKANLSSTNLTKVNLKYAKLLQANLTKASLSEANLLAVNFTAADLSGANLMQSNLTHANLTAANLSGAILTMADLSGTNFTAADLSNARLNSAKFSNTNLSGTNLSKVQLTNANFDGSNLSGANLTGLSLVGINFKGAKLSRANLSGANLCGASLYQQDLSGVNLTKADLRGANLKGANLGGANLEGANLSGAILPDGTVHE